jgi:leucyl aminopeptidase
MSEALSIQLETTSLPLTRPEHTGLLVGVAEGAEVALDLAELVARHSAVGIAELKASGELKGSFREFHVLYGRPDDGPLRRIVLIGLGKREKLSLDTVRSVAAKGARTLRRLHCDTMVVDPTSFFGLEPAAVARACAEGVVLGIHRFKKRIKQAPEDFPFRRLVLLSPPELEPELLESASRGVVVAEATRRAREIANEPGATMTPRLLAEECEAAGRRWGFDVEAFGPEELMKMNMGGLLAVGRGSEEPCRLIVMRHRPRLAGGGEAELPRIALVGKGVTFDSGGISIKPSKGMHRMKYDMSGAAAVLGAMKAAARLEIGIDLLGIVPAAENMPSGRAYKPGDVLRMHSGHHV